MKVTETVKSRTLRMKIRQMDIKLMRAAIFTKIQIFFFFKPKFIDRVWIQLELGATNPAVQCVEMPCGGKQLT